ncbi:hypothetical protein PhCBS80983_g05023 [Powellomyces hirtus]|uniref:RNI-like protein n=1 Tax=Powellomyces hirtus TaxID=109895 RepID=A0A507DY76_9FUNG|nr:hypothetical protein PhCBS80983_g05023 [Powellomyces hirtus]
MSRNQVRGPSSALSSFLRERGIRAPPRNVWQRRNTTAEESAENGAATANTEEGDNVNGQEVEETNSTPASSRDAPPAPGRRRAARGTSAPPRENQVGLEATVMEVEVEIANGSGDEDLEELAEEEEEETESAQTTRRRAKAQTAKARPKAKAKAAAGKKRKNGKESDDDFNANDDDKDIGAARSNHSKRRKTGPLDGASGSIRFCNRCQRRYIVSDDKRTLCPACVSLQAAPGTSGAPKKTTKRKKGTLIPEGSEESSGAVKSLRDMCIKLIADYIDSVEEFGDISESTKLQLAKIIGRHRQLNPQNVRLFVGPNEDRVNLFECTYLDDAALSKVAQMCPNVRQLHLGNCGRIKEDTLKIIGENCELLQSLTLDGPFLPSNQGFITMFNGLGDKLQELTLRHAAKLSKTGVDVLVANSPGLTTLRLDQCLKLDDDSIRVLADLKHLQVLEIGFMGEKIAEDSFIHLVQNVGAQLRSLSLNGHVHLSDKVLTEAIAPTCLNLNDLSLEECEGITSDGMLEFIRAFTPTSGLTSLSLSRNVHMKDDLLVAIVNAHGPTLLRLNINGLDELTEYSLRAIAAGCPMLRELDVSWIRNVDDFMLEELISKSRPLAKVKVYGCNKLSDVVINRHNINDEGKEIRFVGNEYI